MRVYLIAFIPACSAFHGLRVRDESLLQDEDKSFWQRYLNPEGRTSERTLKHSRLGGSALSMSMAASDEELRNPFAPAEEEPQPSVAASTEELLEACSLICVDVGTCDATCSQSVTQQMSCAKTCAFEKCDLPISTGSRESFINKMAQLQKDHCLFGGNLDLLDHSMSMSMAPTAAPTATPVLPAFECLLKITCEGCACPFEKNLCEEGNNAIKNCAITAAPNTCPLPADETDKEKYLKEVGREAKRSCFRFIGLVG